MKLNKKLFFFLIFTFIFSGVLFFSQIQSVSAQTNSETIITSDWLYAAVGDFYDATPSRYENDLQIDIGGKDLISFKNLGIISSTDTSILYGGEVLFGYEINAFTTVSINDAFPNLNTQNKEEITFLWVSHNYGFSVTDYSYKGTWTDVRLGTVIQHEYGGSVPVTIGIKSLTVHQGTLNLNGVEFPMPSFAFNVLGSEAVYVRSGTVGDYNDYFTEPTEYDDLKATFYAMEDYSGQGQTIMNKVNAHNPGIYPSGRYEETETLVQSKRVASQSNFDNINPVLDQTFTFDLGFQLQPQITRYEETITRNWVSLGVNHGWFETTYQLLAGTSTHRRTVGAHVYNQYIHWDMRVKVLIYATVETNAETTSSILRDPYLKLGDWVWDPEFTGGFIEVSVPVGTWWDTIGGVLRNIILIILFIAIVIIILYLFVKIGVPLLIRKSLKSKKRRSI